MTSQYVDMMLQSPHSRRRYLLLTLVCSPSKNIGRRRRFPLAERRDLRTPRNPSSHRLMVGLFAASWNISCKGERYVSWPKWTDWHISAKPVQSRRHMKRSEKSVKIPQYARSQLRFHCEKLAS